MNDKPRTKISRLTRRNFLVVSAYATVLGVIWITLQCAFNERCVMILTSNLATPERPDGTLGGDFLF